MRGISVLVVALGACVAEVPVVPRALAPVVAVDHRAAPFTVTDPLDADTDGIPDQLENYLIAQFAPEVLLAPDRADWTRPANVDWYLPQVRLEFAHRMCRDHDVLSPGTVTADSIWRQAHPTESWTCAHTHSVAHSDAGATYERNRGFFLRPASKSTYRGIPVARSDEWRVYAHVQPSSYIRPTDHRAAAYDIQVWFFYAYNLGSLGFNHEADWEHVTISVSSDLEFVSAYYSAHRTGTRFDRASDIAWVDGTHPIVYSARGTHASYSKAGAHRTPAMVDWTYDGGPRWQTWKNFVNLGEREHILDGQDWARYDGRWGRPGWFEITSGPVGPMFSRRWPIAGVEYPHPAIAKKTLAEHHR